MGILNEFERRLEGAIEGIFTKAFRTGLQPVELARRVLREMESGKTVGVRGVWVPNHYVFRLSEEDHERFGQTERALRRELEQVVQDGARERGWALVGPPQVAFEVDPELREGQYTCHASLVEGPTPAPGAAREGQRSGGREDELVVVESETDAVARSFPLTKDRMVIGRLGESDVVLSDPGVSRRHAEIRTEDGRWVIVDLGSTNGTMVNERTIGERALEEGDRITIGRTVLEFRRR